MKVKTIPKEKWIFFCVWYSGNNVDILMPFRAVEGQKNTKESFQIEIIILKVLKFASVRVWDLAENKYVKPLS